MEDLVGSAGLAPRNSAEQEETSNLMATNLEPSEWTDEKHLLYLKHMEATFVNQLYKSIDVFGMQLQNNYPSHSKLSKHKEHRIRHPYGQFKVFRDGRWSKFDFKNEQREEESVVLLASPWIQHYKCSESKPVLRSPSHQKKSPIHHREIGCQDSFGSNTEVTDQNFKDEDLEEEERLDQEKTSTHTTSCNDISSN